MTKIKKVLTPEDVTVIIDTREKTPLSFSKMKTSRRTLTTGDYSVAGLELEIALERKSMPDLLACVGRERRRFDNEVKRLLAYPHRALIVEGSSHACESGNWRSDVHPNAVMGSLLGWQMHGLPVFFAETHDRASRIAEWMIWIAVRRKFDQLKSFYENLKIYRNEEDEIGRKSDPDNGNGTSGLQAT